jgi:hypothetical protein
MLGPGPAVLAWGALGMASVVIATVAVASLGALLAIRSPTLRVRQEKHRVARKPSGLRRANEIAHPSSRMSCWQIPDGVGDRVRPQVALHELAESLTTGHGRANSRMLSIFLAAFSVTRMAIWIRLPSMLPSNVTMYRPSGCWNSSTLRGIP